MKMVMISYNEAIDIEVMETLESCALKDYTKIEGTYGRGFASGTHLGTDVWPGRNNILYVACPEKEAGQLFSSIIMLRKRLGKEGIKAFVWNLENIT